MLHFIIFERQFGHCATTLLRAHSLKEALTKFAIEENGVEAKSDGSLVSGDGLVYPHPLALIESEYKSHDKFDELQWDTKNDKLLNGACWEIRALPAEAWDAEIAEVFCSAEPWSLGEYISLCRTELRKKYPRSRARAFVWYLEDGPMVTFHRRQNRADAQPIEVMGRYIIPWQRQHWPNPYSLTPEMVQEWHGTFDDVLTQMRINFPF